MTITSIVAAMNFNVLEQITLGFAASNVPDQVQPIYSYAGGTGSNQCDLHWEATGVTLAAGANVTYTLSALTDAIPRTVAFAHIKGLLITTTTRTAGDYLTTGGAATHAWTNGPAETVYGATFHVADLIDGWAVASGSNDQLKITNSGSHSITFSIAAFGTST
jgi:hypothetical protein